jgi:hypothetical protein
MEGVRRRKVKATRAIENITPIHPLLLDRFRRVMDAAKKRIPVDYGVPPRGTIRFFTFQHGCGGPWYIKTIVSHDRTLSEWINLINTWNKGTLPEKYDTPLSNGNPFTTQRAAAVFLTELLAKELRLRWIARKFVARLRERVYARRTIGADADLCTTIPVPDYAAVFVRDRLSRCRYVFHVKAISTLIRNSLNYSNFGIACPQVPKNPFTNKPWSYSQLISITSQILSYSYLSCFKKHDATIYDFRICNHDISLYFQKYATQLQINGAKSFFSDINNSDTREVRKDMIDDFYEYVGHDICNGWRTIRTFAAEQLLSPDLNNRWNNLITSYWIYLNYNKIINFASHDSMIEEFSNLHNESYSWWCAQPHTVVRRHTENDSDNDLD